MKISYRQFKDTLEEIGFQRQDTKEAIIFQLRKVEGSKIILPKYRVSEWVQTIHLVAAQTTINGTLKRTRYTDPNDFTFVEYVLKSRIADLRRRLPGSSMFARYPGERR